MEARLLRLGLVLFTFTSMGASYRTANFVVHAPTVEIAEKVGKAAEHYRKSLAQEWLKKEMPRWYKPCPIHVKVGQYGAGGATTFSFSNGEVFNWRMNVQGSLERILDSVLPHEISHTIFACHFRRPLPRWADEGAATLVEHDSEQRKQHFLLKQAMRNKRRYRLRQLFAMKEYPKAMEDVLTLYAQGYSLADYLVQKGGKQRYLQFLELAHRKGWDHALQQMYDIESVESFEQTWDGWVVAGSPPLNPQSGVQLASQPTGNSGNQPIVRAQNPDKSSRVALVPLRRIQRRQRPHGEYLEAPDPRGEQGEWQMDRQLTNAKRQDPFEPAWPQNRQMQVELPSQHQPGNFGWSLIQDATAD